jgi:hypothetical protein
VRPRRQRRRRDVQRLIDVALAVGRHDTQIDAALETMTGSFRQPLTATSAANGVVVAGSNPSTTRMIRPRIGRRAVVPMVLLMSA